MKKFKIADDVEVYGYVGKIVEIKEFHKNVRLYLVTYINSNGAIVSSSHYDFELDTASTEEVGFKPNNMLEDKDVPTFKG